MRFDFSHSGKAAFTLTDLLFSTVFVSGVIMAILWCHIMGLKLHNLIDTRISAAAHERKVWDYLTTDLQSAQNLQIGSFQQNLFTPIAKGSLQQGSAIVVYPSISNTNQYIRYQLDNGVLKRYVSTNNSLFVVSSYIQTAKPFQTESATGTVLTNDAFSYVVAVNLAFSRFQQTGGAINNSSYFRSYSLSTKVAKKRIY